MKARHFIKGILPPILLSLLRRISAPPKPDSIRFMGKFDLWEEAESASTGYAAPEILKRTRAAMAKVKNDEAIFERDSVLLATPEYPFPLIVGLLRAALLADGRLSVLDFGGALGSTYFQCRKFLSAVKDMRWSVVEQPDHVACGQAEFSNEELRFYPTAEECLTSQRPNLLLLSSVLQYLPAPYDMLRQLLTYRIPHVVIDRTAFLVGNRERLSVQSVPKSIYQATYPAWFFNEPKFVAFCNEMNYKLVADFDGADHVSLSQPQEESYFKGFIFDLEERS